MREGEWKEEKGEKRWERLMEGDSREEEGKGGRRRRLEGVWSRN